MSSDTNNTTEEWRDQISSERRAIAGMIRVMPIKLTVGGTWRVEGHLLVDNITRETRDAAIFMGIGFASRSKGGANADAVVVFPGGSSNPVIIATRDEDARRAVANLEQDSTTMFNRSTIILIKPDGTVEIRASSGVASPLATKADIDALKLWASTHTHSGVSTGPGASGPPVVAPPVALGTGVLRAQ